MSFQVYWIGSSKPTWEPWNTILRTLALFQYLKNYANKALWKITPNVEIEDIVLENSVPEIEQTDPKTITSADNLRNAPLEF